MRADSLPVILTEAPASLLTKTRDSWLTETWDSADTIQNKKIQEDHKEEEDAIDSENVSAKHRENKSENLKFIKPWEDSENEYDVHTPNRSVASDYDSDD